MNIQFTQYFNVSKKLDYQFTSSTNPILSIAASFWEDDRYEAAKLCYISMRVIDDLIDNHRAAHYQFSEVEKQKLTMIVKDWIDNINNITSSNTIHQQLAKTIKRYHIPQWPWRKFSKSMIYDIYHNGFRTFPIFLRYAEGAAVAPASIFMHFCGTTKENGEYNPPRFDIREVARPAALFSYLVHIIRDFQKDQINNLNFFSEDLMTENGLHSSTLQEIAAGGTITPSFRRLMKRYYTLADYYRLKTKRIINKISPYLGPRYQLSLKIIYGLYLQIFERIDIHNSRFTTAELTPSTQEVKNLINLIVS